MTCTNVHTRLVVDQDYEASALRAATAYYSAGETMDAISEQLGVSRSTVSRLLKFARESGIVEIRINPPDADGSKELARALSRRLRVTARVASPAHDAGESERLDVVSAAAARILTETITSHMTVGIAWGSTLSAVSRHLGQKSTTGARMVQLNGSGNMRTTGLGYASDILRRFGQAFTAQVQQFPVPAFFDDPATKAALWRERSMRRIVELQEHLDLVVFSTGARESSVPSHVYTGDYLDPEDIAALEAEHVVGDVATVFYRVDGSSADIALNDRGSGPSLHTLARVPRRICIAAGESKAESVRGALAAGLVTDLVVDDEIARALLG